MTDEELDGFQDLALKTKPWRFDKESIDRYMEVQVSIRQKNHEENIRIAYQIISSIKKFD